MEDKNRTYSLTVAAMLCAVGLVIPMFMPIKIIVEPASYTLASHVPIFIAMLISPGIAAMVDIGVTLGFLIAGFPLTVVARAFSQVIFAVIGAFILKKHPNIMRNKGQLAIFAVLISILHAVSEVIAVLPFYVSTLTGQEFLHRVILLVGVGTVVHSLVDFALALIIWRAVGRKSKLGV